MGGTPATRLLKERRTMRESHALVARDKSVMVAPSSALAFLAAKNKGAAIPCSGGSQGTAKGTAASHGKYRRNHARRGLVPESWMAEYRHQLSPALLLRRDRTCHLSGRLKVG